MSGKPIAWVTGANRGIGRACCVRLAGRGFDLVGFDLARDADTEETERLVADAGGRLTFVRGDIAAIDGHAAWAESALRSGPVSCLVNNAGVQTRERVDLLDLAPAEFDRVMGVNLRGTFFFTQTVVRLMLADTPRAGRSIITITSSAATAANPRVAAYCMSKTGLSMMVRMFALRLADAGIAVHEIRPGIVRTAMTGPDFAPYERLLASGQVPLKRWGEADDVGRMVSSLAAGDVPYSTGDAFHISGGLQIEQIG